MMLPLTLSVDIRQSAYKMAVVDANLFPAGFNNLLPKYRQEASEKIKAYLQASFPCRRVLLIAEEHTRNAWYLENVWTLQAILQQAGFEVVCTSFLTTETTVTALELPTASGKTVQMHYFLPLLKKVQAGELHFDAAMLNNDLTTGIPDTLKILPFPVLPSMHAGWHTRKKSMHFDYANSRMEALCLQSQTDPWLKTCLFSKVESVDIQEDESRKKLAQAAFELLEKITLKYREYRIEEKPFIFLKADSGTYGMGVMAVETPEDILNFNRKARNNLTKGKNAQDIHHFILQEGVPSVHRCEGRISEPCLYAIGQDIVGGFYRVNTQKSDRENLNSQGMLFEPMEGPFEPYKTLVDMAALACSDEIESLEKK